MSKDGACYREECGVTAADDTATMLGPEQFAEFCPALRLPRLCSLRRRPGPLLRAGAPRRRFKAFLLNEPAQRIAVAFSADGLHWSPPIDWAEHDTIGDAHPNTLRLPDGQGYVGFMRGLKGQELANGPAARPIRLLRRTASRDFVH